MNNNPRGKVGGSAYSKQQIIAAGKVTGCLVTVKQIADKHREENSSHRSCHTRYSDHRTDSPGWKHIGGHSKDIC